MLKLLEKLRDTRFVTIFKKSHEIFIMKIYHCAKFDYEHGKIHKKINEKTAIKYLKLLKKIVNYFERKSLQGRSQVSKKGGGSEKSLRLCGSVKI